MPDSMTMRTRRIRMALIMSAAIVATCLWGIGATWSAFAAELRLAGATPEKIVIVERHGIRSPTQKAAVLDAWSARPWPRWSVPRGALTERGAALVSSLWRTRRNSTLFTALLGAAGGCPDPTQVFVRADVDERTQATAAALLQGLAPECGLGYLVADSAIDPLFHPVEAGIASYPEQTIRKRLEQGGHALLERVVAARQQELIELSAITGEMSAPLCRDYGLDAGCTPAIVPDRIAFGDEGHSIHLMGGLGIASSVAEIWLLERGEWPERIPGWGLVDDALLRRFSSIHVAAFDLVNREPQVATINGGLLLASVSEVLADQHADPELNKAKLVVYVAHDTNIANLAGMLALDWKHPGYADNDIPPASMLQFTRWRKADGSGVVTVAHVVQTFESYGSPLGVWNSGENVCELTLRCGTKGDAECTPDAFLGFVQNLLTGIY